MKHATTDDDVRTVASFRYALRTFEFWSEQATRALGLTTQQYQALLAIRGHDDVRPFTVKSLAQFLLIKHNSAVELVDRIAELGFAERRHTDVDRRRVVVELTPQGRQVLKRLVAVHRRELARVAPEFLHYFRHFAQDPAAGE
jgi:DNA-binding MarR family transcriptional regulator